MRTGLTKHDIRALRQAYKRGDPLEITSDNITVTIQQACPPWKCDMLVSVVVRHPGWMWRQHFDSLAVALESVKKLLA